MPIPDRRKTKARPRRAARRLLLGPVLGLALCAGAPQAAPFRQPDGAELLRRIERLGVVGNVLYVAAHPDDENTRLLAYFGGDRLLRTAYLSLTRGDGGQNLIGAEQGALLGLIRTQELLAARRIDGAEQLFTRVRDFGYSKTPAETLAIWGHDEALADVVWAIRRFRPDVVVSRFPVKGLDTHGQHTASALLTAEAFTAAADPRRFPEQLKHVGPWQARRLVENKPIWFLKPSDDMSRFLKLDTGVYDPVRGVSFTEVAAAARTMHKSQGFGVAGLPGPGLEYFEVRAGAPAQRDLFEGIDLTWGRVPGAAKLAALLKEAAQRFDLRHPEASIPTLLAARAALQQLPDNPWKGPKLLEIDDAIVACAGLFAEATASTWAVAPGQPLPLKVTALNRSAAPVALASVALPGAAVAVNRRLKQHDPYTAAPAITVARDTPISNPYWLQEPGTEGRYQVADQRLVGVPETPPALVAGFVFRVHGQEVRVRRPIVYKWTDPVAGERARAVEVGPLVTVTPEAPVLIFPDRGPRTLLVRVRALGADVRGSVRLQLPPGFTATPARAPFGFGPAGGAVGGAEAEVRFTVRPPAATAGGTVRVVAEAAGAEHPRGVRHVEYPHIPIVVEFPAAEVAVRRFDLKHGRGRIGYVEGAGDEVPAALRQAGYDVTLLDDAALEHAPLGRYAAIVVGVRAFNTRPRLLQALPRLLDFVAAGGTLVEQYNTNNRLAPLKAQLGPYPFEISQERVTDERAAASFEAPAHPLLTRPNRITAADFEGWVQERGLYFAGTWDQRYQTPLAMHDAGEPPRRGGVLFTRHGKGVFIYTGLAFFRQLPAGVPGAYRLFANLIDGR
jgi:LmbE family N-acetylglucosaminyl deacetylase